MDQWFSLEDAGSEAALATRYQDAIGRVTQPSSNVLTGNAASLTNKLSGGTNAVNHSFQHFDSDWLNFANLSSGGDFWPQIPSWSIVIWLRQGVLSAAKKALGVNYLSGPAEAALLFKYEEEVDPVDPRDRVLPLITCWVCTSGPGTGGFEVDAVRGPTAVQLVIATPAPYQQSHIWPFVKTQIDQMWATLHPDQHLPEPPPPDFMAES